MDWLDIATKVGLPVTMLAVVLYALWKAVTAVWARAIKAWDEYIVPAIKKHMETLDNTIKNNDAQTRTLQSMNDCHTQSLKQVVTISAEMLAEIKALSADQKEIKTNVLRVVTDSVTLVSGPRREGHP